MSVGICMWIVCGLLKFVIITLLQLEQSFTAQILQMSDKCAQVRASLVLRRCLGVVDVVLSHLSSDLGVP